MIYHGRRSVAKPATERLQILAELLFQPPLLHPSVMLRREVFVRHGGYDEAASHAEDYALWVRLMPHARFGNCPRVLMDYTLSPAQVSRRHNVQQLATARRLRIAALGRLGIACTPEQVRIPCRLA